MAEKKSERAKIFITVGLAVVLVISGYFRLIHAKIRKSGAPPTSQSSLAPINIPTIQIPTIQTEQQPDTKQPEPDHLDFMQSAIRDIFAEPADKTPEENRAEVEQTPPPPLSLKGTIVGGKSPIAIINGHFVRMGNRIGDYQVVGIDKDRVTLRSGNNEIVLEVLKHVQK